MPKRYEKVSDSEFKEIETNERVLNLDILNGIKESRERDKASLEQSIDSIQAEIDAIQLLIDEGKALGVREKNN